MNFQTKFVQDLCATDTATFEELLLLVLNEPAFLQNVQNLRKPALEALVYALLMKQRGKLPGTLLTSDSFNLKSILSLIQLNQQRLQEDNDSFRWLLSALTLTVLIENNGSQAVYLLLEPFVDRFDRELHEIPLYYDVLRTLFVLAKEDPGLVPLCGRLSGERMVHRLTSSSNRIRMQALACLQTLMEFNAELYGHWLKMLNCPNQLIESKMFVLHQLLKTLLRCAVDRTADILQMLQLDHVWLTVTEGLTANDPVCRKEALATIQYAIGYANQCEEDLSGQYFCWPKAQTEPLATAWQTFVTIVQALNETQAHLVLPALELLDKVKPLHVVWHNVLLRLMLQHENGRVVNYVLCHFLRHRSYDPAQTELERQFLEAFNRTAVLDDVPGTIAQLGEYYGTQEAYAGLLHTAPQIRWQSVPYYCIASAIHHRTYELADDLKRSNETVGTLRALTACIKLCHDIKNVSLRYITLVLLVNSVNVLCDGTTDADLLIAVVAEMEKLTPTFSLTLEPFRAGSPFFYDHLEDNDLLKLAERFTVSDTFFIEQVLAERLLKGGIGNWRLVPLLDSNAPVYVMLLQHHPELVHYVSGWLYHIVRSVRDSVRETVAAGEKISSTTCTMVELLFGLNRSIIKQNTGGTVEGLCKLQYDIRQIVSPLLECFDYTPTSAMQTIQLAQLISDGPDMLNKFFGCFSLNKFKDSFGRRHPTESDPSVDQLYAMIAKIYLHWRQHNHIKCSSYSEDEHEWEGTMLTELLDVGNIDVLTLVIEILHVEHAQLLEEAYEEPMRSGRVDVLRRCYEEILIYRNSDHFMRLMGKFFRMIFRPYAQKAEYMDDIYDVYVSFPATEYVKIFLEHAVTISGLANVVYENLLQLPVIILIDQYFEMRPTHTFDKVLLMGMLFGEAQKPDQKYGQKSDTFEFDVIASSGVPVPFQQHSGRYNQADARVRVQCVLFLYRVASTNDPNAVLFLQKMEQLLIERFAELTKAKERYYADSITHRLKLRIVQALCVVLKLTGTQPYALMDVMLYETNQPNINYLLELIVANSSISTLTIANTLRDEKLKVSGVQSVFVILWLRCCRAKNLDKQYINLLLPWTMAQNFSTRLYAQITIKKMLERFPAACKTGQLKQIHTAVNSYLRQGNVERNIERCMKDFRFNSVLDYKRNLLTLENVFHNVPKVSGVPPEDVVGTALLKECLRMNGGHGQQALGQALELEALPADRRETLFLAPSVGGADFVQRKIDCTDGLIVVASLVNRAPNLGGIARTGEIFAIKQLVIDSLQDIGNKEFQALSMTAEKWLNVGELKAHKLIEYLREMKYQGYAVVGAEQTTGSKPIQQLRFPKKCILVLGHEKNGLPAEIIRHLDLIGEIPQFGVVRSLNVHVTAAIFMWEYAKQHHVAASDTEPCIEVEVNNFY
uniref:tRNA/rRNA methyltransferase SpoU type domain-containing protein n=1 Tax=Anopheles epiroticus TaxID=199890 RepID=A0A182PW31_9DIPT